MANRIEMNLTVSDVRKQVAEPILINAVQGLKRTAQFALGRAKHHAPVRAIFDRGQSPRGRAIPKGRDVKGSSQTGWRFIRSERQYESFLASKERRVGMQLPGAGGGLMARSQAGGNIPGSSRSRAGIGGRGTGFSGHANTLFPVLTNAQGVRSTGDFRRKDASMFRVFQRQGRNSKMVQGKGAEAASGRGKALSAAGRREIKRATGGSREQRLASGSGLYRGRVGGRLRGELRVTGPVQGGDGAVWMYVESPTPYAIHQEFGTTNHRAQPFLRPALYESRSVLRREVRKAISNPRKRLDRSDDPRTSFSKRAVN